MPGRAVRSKPLIPAAEQARQDARSNSLFFGLWEVVRSRAQPEAFAIFGGQKKRSKARDGGNPLPWTVGMNWDS